MRRCRGVDRSAQIGTLGVIRTAVENARVGPLLSFESGFGGNVRNHNGVLAASIQSVVAVCSIAVGKDDSGDALDGVERTASPSRSPLCRSGCMRLEASTRH